MASEKIEPGEVDKDGKIAPKRRFDKRDFRYIAEGIIEEWNRRKRNRTDREKDWAEIDRQIAMKPNIEFKRLPNGKLDSSKLWMAEMELPLQAQALEVLTADARRMLFPDAGPWFRAKSQLTDAYLKRIDFQSIILGDETEVPSQINQDNADKLVEGFIVNQLRQYDFGTRLDRVNAEAFKYGMGVARGRMQTRSIFVHEARGTMHDVRRIPVLAPCSIKNLYLDEPEQSMHSVYALGESHIALDYIKFENIALAASRGSNDPEDEDGGWMPAMFKDLLPDDKGYVTLLEMEGDIIVPRKSQRSFVIPNAIVTVAIGGKDAGGVVTNGVIRFRLRKTPWSSYLLFPYHYEGADDHYPTSPLMKGRPVQMMATDALNRTMDGAALKNAPPVGYDRNDMNFASSGGPEIYPYAQWPSIDGVKVHSEVGGDPAAMAGIMARGIQLYSELTGVLPARLGAQTISHTTAFAKSAELQQGATRTVDYVNTIGHGPITRWLHMSYYMGKAALKRNEAVEFYIDAYGGYVSITRDQLPDDSGFEWFGSGGPAEERQKQGMKMQSLQLALQMDTLGQQTGRPPQIDLTAAIKETLRSGGWTDLDLIVPGQPAGIPQSLPPPAPGEATDDGSGAGLAPTNPGAQTVALQQLGLAANNRTS